MLPSSATHLLQPLDVAIFSSLKRSWRVILDEWKKEVRKKVSLDKKYFPSLLKRLVNTQEQNMKKKICNQCLEHVGYAHYIAMSHLKLPTQDTFISESNSSLNETLIDLLKKNCGCDRENQKQTHGKKMAKPGEVLSLTMLEQHVM